MDHLFFTIYFTYDIKPTTMQVDLSAVVEMTDDTHCIVSEIRRRDTEESPLLPELKLKKTGGAWILANTGKESNISTTVGDVIDKHLKELSKIRNEMKNE